MARPNPGLQIRGQKSVPVHEGVTWNVVWSEKKPNVQTGLCRYQMPGHPESAGGEYGVDIYGELY